MQFSCDLIYFFIYFRRRCMKIISFHSWVIQALKSCSSRAESILDFLRIKFPNLRFDKFLQKAAYSGYYSITIQFNLQFVI